MKKYFTALILCASILLCFSACKDSQAQQSAQNTSELSAAEEETTTVSEEKYSDCRYEARENAAVKYVNNKKVWSAEILTQYEATPEAHGLCLENYSSKGTDKIRIYYGMATIETYKATENDSEVGFITAINAESGEVIFRKVFDEFADFSIPQEDDPDITSYVSAAAIRDDGNIDVFYLTDNYDSMLRDDGYYDWYTTHSTILITLDSNGNIISQREFSIEGTADIVSDAISLDDGYIILGIDENNMGIIARIENDGKVNSLVVQKYEYDYVYDAIRLSLTNGKYSLENMRLNMLGENVFLTAEKVSSDINWDNVVSENETIEDYMAEHLNMVKKGYISMLYTVDFENKKLTPYEIEAGIINEYKCNDFFENDGNICLRVRKITAEKVEWDYNYDGTENAEFWIYVFDKNGNPIESFPTGIPAKTSLPFVPV